MKNIYKILKVLFLVVVSPFNDKYAEKYHESVILTNQNKHINDINSYLLWDNKKIQTEIKENEKKENEEIKQRLKSTSTSITRKKRIRKKQNICRKKSNKIHLMNVSKSTNSKSNNVRLNNKLRRSSRIITCKNNNDLVNFLNKNGGNDEFSEWNENNPLELRIINKNNRVPSYIKPVLCEVQGKQVNSILSKDLEEMITAASKRGLNLRIVSCYRSYNHQKNLLHTFARNIKRRNRKMTYKQALAKANRRAALPGASEHNLGIAVDFGNNTKQRFINTKEYQWMKNNAYKFGFIERYKLKWTHKTHTIYEPWHFRYVGKDNAEEIEKSGLCLEDFVRQKMCKKIDNDKQIRTIDDSLNDLFTTLDENNVESQENLNRETKEDIEINISIEENLNQVA